MNRSAGTVQDLPDISATNGAGSDAAPRRSRQHDAVSTSTVLVILGTFLASAVEMVEALTIVLAVGVTRGWRSPLIGVAAATVALVAIIAALGPALQHLPIDVLRANSVKSAHRRFEANAGSTSC